MTMYVIPLRLNFFFLLHFNETVQIPGTCPLCSIHSATVPRYLPSRKHCRIIISSVQFSCSVMSDSLRPHESQHARPPCPLPTPRVHSDSDPLSQWCHLAISSSVVPLSSCPQSLPASESFPMSQLFAWGGQSTGVSALASFLPKKSWGKTCLSNTHCVSEPGSWPMSQPTGKWTRKPHKMTREVTGARRARPDTIPSHSGAEDETQGKPGRGNAPCAEPLQLFTW